MTPLLLDGAPAIAYPYAEAAQARRVAAAAEAALVLSDDRLTGRDWQPLVVSGRPRLIEDREGDLFCAQLLDQELCKYPPSRALIDSPLLRREHWWYLPRLLVVLAVRAVRPVAPRPQGEGEVLAVAIGASRLWVDTVDRPDPAQSEDRPARLRLARQPGGPAGQSDNGGWPGAAGSAVLIGHDFSVPDLECWTPWVTTGWLREGDFTVESRPSETGLAPPPSLWARWRRQRQLERACRAQLA